ncbi:hypothetical protein MMC17_001457 [Xylographa soralifera]|nr:hypothetical protein [Xylographa soralifera]
MVERSHKQKIANYSNESRGSLRGRIGASTSALMRATIVKPQPKDVPEILVAISSALSKSGPSSGVANQLTSSRHQTYENDNFVNGSRAGSLLPEGFRIHAYESSTTSLQHEFDLFSATSTTDPAQVSHGHETSATSQSRHGKQRRSWAGDGAEVVDLLSDPRAFVDELPPDPSIDPQFFDDYPKSWKPDDVDRINFSRIGNGLTAPPVHHSPSPTNPLNFLPDFDFGYSFVNKDLMITVSAEPMTIENGISSKSSADPSSANFEPWLDVLTRYQDDVWGDMLPLVKEARAEINIISAKSGTAPENRPAIRRLGMLLGHFNDFSNANRASGPFTPVYQCQFKSDS